MIVSNSCLKLLSLRDRLCSPVVWPAAGDRVVLPWPADDCEMLNVSTLSRSIRQSEVMLFSLMLLVLLALHKASIRGSPTARLRSSRLQPVPANSLQWEASCTRRRAGGKLWLVRCCWCCAHGSSCHTAVQLGNVVCLQPGPAAYCAALLCCTLRNRLVAYADIADCLRTCPACSLGP
jgi:hypothetical protein